MEPLHPGLRDALKRAHPQLTDEDIDRFQELLARRMDYDPVTEADEIERVDRERMEMMRRVMPHYAEVTRAFAAQNAPRREADDRRVRTTIKRPES